jgi:ariadne-1
VASLGDITTEILGDEDGIEDDSCDESDSAGEYSGNDYNYSDDSENEGPSLKLAKQSSHEGVQPEELVEQRTFMVNQLVSALHIPPSKAEILLISKRWGVDDVFHEFRKNPEALFEGAGLCLPVVPTSAAGDGESQNEDGGEVKGQDDNFKDNLSEDDNDEFECPVCLDDVPRSETFALVCNHRFCLECWRSHLSVAVASGAKGLLVSCPRHDCSELCGSEVFLALLPEEGQRAYHKLMEASFIAQNDGVVWCPRPGCTYAVVGSVRKKNLKCKCGHRFCYSCKEEAHAPATCSQASTWLEKLYPPPEEEGSGKKKKKKKKLVRTTKGNGVKPCPSCKLPSIKV